MRTALIGLVALTMTTGCFGPGRAEGPGGVIDLPADQKLELVATTIEQARTGLELYLVATSPQPNAEAVLAAYDTAAEVFEAAYAGYLEDGRLLGREAVSVAVGRIRGLYTEYLARVEMSPSDRERRNRRAQYLSTLVLLLPWDD